MKLMGKEYREFSYFNMTILILTLISTFISTIILPQIIVGPPSRINEVKLVYLVDIWRSMDLTLPNLTLIIVKFGEEIILRYLLVVVVILGLVTLELINKKQIINFIIYIVILVLSIILGYLTLLAALIPMMPL